MRISLGVAAGDVSDMGYNKLEFISVSGMLTDATCVYEVHTRVPMDVGTFLNEISKRNEFGVIDIYSLDKKEKSSVGRYDKNKVSLIPGFDISLLDRMIDHISSAGGWGRMDYTLYLKD